MKDNETKAYVNEQHAYPFVVSERNEEGKFQLARFRDQMHGFSIIKAESVPSQLFNGADQGGTMIGSDVYEIRVKNQTDDWQDWQAIIGDIQVVPCLQLGLDQTIDDMMADMNERFKENFQIRYSGTLWRSHFGEVVIIDEDINVVKRINPFTLQIEYMSDLDNYCISFKKQMKQQKRFRKKYFAKDESGRRL